MNTEIMKPSNIITLNTNSPVPFTAEERQRSLGLLRQRVDFREGALAFEGDMGDRVFCHGFLDYLAKAWGHHYGVRIRPDDLWYMVLCELAMVVQGQPDLFASLFTTLPGEKQEVLVPTDDITRIDPALVIDQLKRLVPVPVEAFLPNFTTSTPDVYLACSIAFCDMVSPYYNYGTYLCGIPFVEVLGLVGDWALLCARLAVLKSTFGNRGLVCNYLDRCMSVVNGILTAAFGNSGDAFFQGMVRIKKCGSGSQHEMDGWIMQLRYQNDNKLQLEGLPPHLSRLHYTNIDTGRKFTMVSGVTTSRVEGNTLVPCYTAFRYEQIKPTAPR